MSRSARTAERDSCTLTAEVFRVLQLNVRKQQGTQLSVMNDDELKGYGALAISVPHVRIIDDQRITTPMAHQNWTKMVPTERREGRWPVRSMLWIRSDLEADQIPVKSADITAARIRLPDRELLMASVYVAVGDPRALEDAIAEMDNLIRRIRGTTGARMDVLLVGDFNSHDQLWGGDDVSASRQGEADLIVDLMAAHSLCSLLPRGTKTWQGPHSETTIDLVLASAEIADEVTRCCIHPTEHGSDHRAIETHFDVSATVREIPPRLLFKNAPWKDICATITADLKHAPIGGSVQEQTDRIMTAVLAAVHELTPKAKPSAYAKRWWTSDLTQLRKAYTHTRNRARTQRRAGNLQPHLEQQAKEASKEYHDAIRQQKLSHWREFLEDNTNIWQAAKYLKDGNRSSGDKVPPLKTKNGKLTGSAAEQTEVFLETFFPPLPERIEDEGERPQRAPIPDAGIDLTGGGREGLLG